MHVFAQKQKPLAQSQSTMLVPNVRLYSCKSLAPVRPLIGNQPVLDDYDDEYSTQSDAVKQPISLNPDQSPGFTNDFWKISVSSHDRVPVQPKLKINSPGDKYEQEADRIADQVMRMPELNLQRQPETEEEDEDLPRIKPLATKTTPLVQRQVDPEGETEEEPAQAKRDPASTLIVPPGIGDQIRSMRDAGHPLPESTRKFFEPRFGYDFSKVRIHNDAHSMESARALKAKAYTIGRDIVFGGGQYAPEALSGNRLLAHELAHVVQQSCAPHHARRRTLKLPLSQTLFGRVQVMRWRESGNEATVERPLDTLWELARGITS